MFSNTTSTAQRGDRRALSAASRPDRHTDEVVPATSTSKFRKLRKLRNRLVATPTRPCQSTLKRNERDAAARRDARETRIHEQKLAASIPLPKDDVSKPRKSLRFASDTKPTTSMEVGIDFSSTVLLRAGENSQKAIVHTNLLASSTPYFASRLHSASTPPDSTTEIILPDTIHPKALSIFLQWLYGQDPMSDFLYTFPAPALRHLCRAHTLGQHIESVAFRNFCTDTIIDQLQISRLGDVTDMIVEELFPAAYGTPLSRLFMDYLVWQGCSASELRDLRNNGDEKLRLALDAAKGRKKLKMDTQRNARPAYLDEHEKFMYYEGEDVDI